MAATRLSAAPPMAADTAIPADVESWSEAARESDHSALPASPPSAPVGTLSHHFPWKEAWAMAIPKPVIAPTTIAK